jgi:NADPH:quinone reductase-like Zn-dependent oxidoreductase
VIATASASAKKAERIRDYGASEVLDYHGDWPVLVREITGGGAPKAVNAARGQAATAFKAVADGGRLATITGDPPLQERGVAVSGVYVRPDVGSFRPSRSCWPTGESAILRGLSPAHGSSNPLLVSNP